MSVCIRAQSTEQYSYYFVRPGFFHSFTTYQIEDLHAYEFTPSFQHNLLLPGRWEREICRTYKRVAWKSSTCCWESTSVALTSYDVYQVAAIAMHMRTYNGNDTFPRHVTREPCSVTLFITSWSFVPAPNIPSQPRILRSSWFKLYSATDAAENRVSLESCFNLIARFVWPDLLWIVRFIAGIGHLQYSVSTRSFR